ncbi:unnamed protein product [Urochloa humidicola]
MVRVHLLVDRLLEVVEDVRVVGVQGHEVPPGLRHRATDPSQLAAGCRRSLQQLAVARNLPPPHAHPQAVAAARQIRCPHCRTPHPQPCRRSPESAAGRIWRDRRSPGRSPNPSAVLARIEGEREWEGERKEMQSAVG